ncbi:MAG: glycosyl transferase family protein, partial [uncultured bacterium]
GGALRSGFAASSKDLIFYTDCDAQYDPRELAKLYQAMKPDVDMVNGYKIKRGDPWFRILAGRLYHYFVKLAFRLPIRDTDCDFRLVRRAVFKKVKLFENTGTICVELVKKVDHFGFKIAEVPVHHFWRTSGQSQFFNFKRLSATGINLVKLWWKMMVVGDYIN